MGSESTSRIYILFSIIALFAVVLIGRLFFVQVVHGGSFQDQADNQYITNAPNVFSRGSIFFQTRAGEKVSAATLQSGYLIAINPTKIKDARTLFDSINTITPIDEKEFFEKASKTQDPYEEIARRVDA